MAPRLCIILQQPASRAYARAASTRMQSGRSESCSRYARDELRLRGVELQHLDQARSTKCAASMADLEVLHTTCGL